MTISLTKSPTAINDAAAAAICRDALLLLADPLLLRNAAVRHEPSLFIHDQGEGGSTPLVRAPRL